MTGRFALFNTAGCRSRFWGCVSCVLSCFDRLVQHWSVTERCRMEGVLHKKLSLLIQATIHISCVCMTQKKIQQGTKGRKKTKRFEITHLLRVYVQQILEFHLSHVVHDKLVVHQWALPVPVWLIYRFASRNHQPCRQRQVSSRVRHGLTEGVGRMCVLW